MILAKTESGWLKQYLQENGGAMTISLEAMVID
jgi:hypothetical protein